MFDQQARLLYVGKANNLKKRLAAYFQKDIPIKTRKLMSQVKDIKTIITQNEYEALLLEARLIKQHHPRYNILLRDDKSYPYIYLSVEDPYPRIAFYRGEKNLPGLFFGPYPNAGIVRNITNLLQKVFKVRTCTNAFFSTRQRPCLQYQLKRCTAPCVHYVSLDAYNKQVDQVKLFLKGKVNQLIKTLQRHMAESALQLDYEKAAYYRDCIHLLTSFQQQQVVAGSNDFVDIISFLSISTVTVLSVFSIRCGQLWGNRNFTVELPVPAKDEDILQTLLIQYYSQFSNTTHVWPRRVILPFAVRSPALIEQALFQIAHKKIKLTKRCLMRYKAWQKAAEENAQQALQTYLNRKNIIHKQFEALSKACGIQQLTYIYCFDVSHTQGEATVASCVVFDHTGPLKQKYRQFNIRSIKAGDDTAALAQAVERQMRKLINSSQIFPELVIVDGGKAQLNVAKKVLQTLQMKDILLLGVAKGILRKPGLEQLFLSNQQRLELAPNSIAFRLIQYIRDEAHRFAIKAHRRKRTKQSTQSSLEAIKGVGEKRRQLLLKHFSGLQGLKKASVDEIAEIKGISKILARVIKDHC